MTSTILVLISIPILILTVAFWWNIKTHNIREDWIWKDPVNQPLKKDRKM